MKHTCLALVMCLCLLLTGCAGDTVIYQVQCDHDDIPQTETPPTADPEGASLLTGLAMVADRSESRDAERAVFTVTVAAVLLDEGGIVRDVALDGVRTSAAFDDAGVLTGDIASPLLTRQELGEDYGTEADDDWTDLAEELADRACGRTVTQLDQLRQVYPAEMVAAVEKAAANARPLGAADGDELQLALTADLADSLSATGSEPGRVRLGCDAAAVTFDDETITACRIDSLQADVPFDAMGTITADVTANAPTKTELGDAYGMKAYGGAKYEWYQQAENFSRYVTGKTAAQVAGIGVTDGKAAEADLYTSVTIVITPFQELIARAQQGRADT